MTGHVAQTAFVAAPGASASAAPIRHVATFAHGSQPAPALASSVPSGAATATVAAAMAVAPLVEKRKRNRQQRRNKVVTRATAVDAPTKTKQSWRNYGADWEVHKFGGASLNDAELYTTCGDLLLSQSKRDKSRKIPTAAIVSAAGGMTDALVGVVSAALEDMSLAEERLSAASARQKGILLELVPGRPDLTDQVFANIEKDEKGVLSMLMAASMLKQVPAQMIELVAGLGEVWSAQTLAAYLKFTGVEASWVDAREVLIVEETAGGLGEKGTAVDTIQPYWDESSVLLQKFWEETFDGSSKEAPFLVITGFICATPTGRPTTLKRSGSDYSATIFAKVLGSASVNFWKNVNGVYTADPRAVPAAFSIPFMTFDEAMELAYFGGQVLHPSAMVPCIEERIPVFVKNVFNPTHPGTKVYGRGDEAMRWDDQDVEVYNPDMPVKAITSIEKVALVTLSGTSFLGTHGVAQRLMGCLASAGVNVILTSQGSSEHSITVAVDEKEGVVAVASIEEQFQLELARNQETRVTNRTNLSILAIIGEGMKSRTGIAGQFFNSLGQAKVSVVAIAQGASERNISAVVERDDLSLALQAAHDGFTLSDTKVAVAIIGTGQVGTAFIKQVAAFQDSPGRDNNLPAMKHVRAMDIEVRAMCDGHLMLTSELGIPLAVLDDEAMTTRAGQPAFDIRKWEENFSEKGTTATEFLDGKSDQKNNSFDLKKVDIDAMIDCLDTKRIPHKVVIDCTASEEIASKYASWLKRGLHVISPNKKAGAGSLKQYHEMIDASASQTGAIWDYESTCGAQLPVISLIHDLIQTGDQVKTLVGVLSGSLSFVFNELYRNPGMLFSEAVAKACEKGLTEPTLLDDLAGTDTARKALILARELGLESEFSDVSIDSLVPDSISSGSSDAIMKELTDSVDKDIAKRLEDAAAKNERLFYVAEVDVKAGTIKCGLKNYTLEDPPFSLREAETILLFTTDRYPEVTPLIIRGPGAGPEVTASGVLAGLLRLSKTLQ